MKNEGCGVGAIMAAGWLAGPTAAHCGPDTRCRRPQARWGQCAMPGPHLLAGGGLQGDLVGQHLELASGAGLQQGGGTTQHHRVV